jgi:hypothetical protein
VTPEVLIWITANIITVSATLTTLGVGLELVRADSRAARKLTQDQPDSALLAMTRRNLVLARFLCFWSAAIALLGLGMIAEALRHALRGQSVEAFVPIGTVGFMAIWLCVSLAVYHDHHAMRRITAMVERERRTGES